MLMYLDNDVGSTDNQVSKRLRQSTWPTPPCDTPCDSQDCPRSCGQHTRPSETHGLQAPGNEGFKQDQTTTERPKTVRFTKFCEWVNGQEMYCKVGGCHRRRGGKKECFHSQKAFSSHFSKCHKGLDQRADTGDQDEPLSGFTSMPINFNQQQGF